MIRLAPLCLVCVGFAQQIAGIHCPRGQDRPPDAAAAIAWAQGALASPAAEKPRAGKRRMAAPVNFIDEILFAAQDAAGLNPAELTDDANFIRRVTLDLTGKPPAIESTLFFLKDGSIDKRARYIDALLASDDFVDHWAYWFGELFQNNHLSLYRQGNWIFHQYLREATAVGKPLNQLAQELVTASGNSFQSGPINFRVRASESVRLAQDRNDNTTAQWLGAFLGVPARCISCHNGAGYLEQVNLYLSGKTRQEFWATAAFVTQELVDYGRQGTESQYVGFTFSQNPEPGYLAETDDGDRPPRRGGMIQPAFLFDGAGPDEGEAWNAALARMITTNRQFARNFANRLWAHMMGLGIVEPLDEFDLARLDPANPPPEPWEVQPRQPELLEALTDSLIDGGYDLRGFLRTIALSHSYQQRAKRFAALSKAEIDNYAVFLPRRLTAESVADSVNVATGIAEYVTYFYPDDYSSGAPVTIVERYRTAHERPDVNMVEGLGEAFGPGNRFDVPRNNAGSLDQALAVMNSPSLLRRLGSLPKNYRDFAADYRLVRIARGKLALEEKVRRTYLAILTREPNMAEMQRALELVGDRPFEEAAEDLHWVLFNHVEFFFNY